MSLFDSSLFVSTPNRGTTAARPIAQPYPFSRADGAAVARPLIQVGDGGSIPTSALHLNFLPIGLSTARQLVALWHSVLPFFPPMAGGLPFHDCYVAEYDEHWYAVAIWTGPVNRDMNDGTRYELRRLAIAPTAPPNTASRMLGYMARDIKRRRSTINELISYQMTSVHTGTIYRAAGWAIRHLSKGHPWDNKGRGRPRLPDQYESDKVCWHRLLRETGHVTP